MHRRKNQQRVLFDYLVGLFGLAALGNLKSAVAEK
jgi:hypothetical protein